MKLIFGLGNPGKEYQKTRHNVGWSVVEALAEEFGATFRDDTRFKGKVADVSISGEKALLVLPTTFMNLSGECVSALAHFYKTPPSDLLIVQDEMDLPVGRVAFLRQGGDAGHNGIASIQRSLATDEVSRLRIGIGRSTGPIAKEAYVLQPFTKDEDQVIHNAKKHAGQAVKDWAALGLAKSMNLWNGVE